MKSRDQGAGMESQESDSIRQLVRSALTPVGDQALERDLWPAMLRRFNEQNSGRVSRVPWFDWALAGGLVAFAASVPRAIPVILYYL